GAAACAARVVVMTPSCQRLQSPHAENRRPAPAARPAVAPRAGPLQHARPRRCALLPAALRRAAGRMARHRRAARGSRHQREPDQPVAAHRQGLGGALGRAPDRGRLRAAQAGPGAWAPAAAQPDRQRRADVRRDRGRRAASPRQSARCASGRPARGARARARALAGARFSDARRAGLRLRQAPETGSAGPMKTLLIVYHTGGVKTAQMAEAVERGARGEEGVNVVVKRCAEAGPEDVLAADALILGTPENFGYMSGMMKDFLERVFYACEGKVN